MFISSYMRRDSTESEEALSKARYLEDMHAQRRLRGQFAVKL